jgi:hypothetical protein
LLAICDAQIVPLGNGTSGFVTCGTQMPLPLTVYLLSAQDSLQHELRGNVGLEALAAPDQTIIGPNWVAFGTPALTNEVLERLGGQSFSPTMTQPADGCDTSDLQTRIGPVQRISFGQVSHGALVKISNVSDRPCTVIGSPGAILQSASGQQLTEASSATGITSDLDLDPAKTIKVGPGKVVWSTIAWWSGGSTPSSTLELILPNGSRSEFPLEVQVDTTQEFGTTPIRTTKPAFNG